MTEPATFCPHTNWLDVRDYLGERFDAQLCHGGDQKVLDEFARYATPAEFYAQTEIYIYHSVAYFLEGVKRPYYARLMAELPHGRPSLLDYGCGAGDDGLFFYAAGLRVAWADLPSRAFDFLAWRAPRRVNAGRAYLVGEPIPRHDYVWCMDVLEHLEPERHRDFLEYLTCLGQRVFVNLVADPEARPGGLHNPVDVAGLTAWALARWPGEYHDYYDGRVRLLLLGDPVTTLALSGEDERL